MQKNTDRTHSFVGPLWNNRDQVDGITSQVKNEKCQPSVVFPCAHKKARIELLSCNGRKSK